MENDKSKFIMSLINLIFSVSDIVFDIILFFDYLEYHKYIVYVSSIDDKAVPG